MSIMAFILYMLAGTNLWCALAYRLNGRPRWESLCGLLMAAASLLAGMLMDGRLGV